MTKSQIKNRLSFSQIYMDDFVEANGLFKERRKIIVVNLFFKYF